MNALDLVEALRALAPAGINVYPSEAPSDAVLPWLVLNVTLPDSQTGDAGQHFAGTGELLVTVAALTEDSAIIWAGRVLESWRGARIAPGGWSVGALQHINGVRVFPDTVTRTETNLRVSVAKLSFTFTCSEV